MKFIINNNIIDLSHYLMDLEYITTFNTVLFMEY